jgi:hypothetical protein
MRTFWPVLALALLLLVVPSFAADKDEPFTDEGFLRTWLVLAPIPLDEGQSGADGLAKEQVKDEAKLQPREGDKVKAGTKELVWKKHQTPEHLVDFNAILGAQTEDSVAYAICYLVADAEMKGLKMKTGSDDQLKVYLNGKEVFKFTEARAADKDQDTTPGITLNKGVNTLIMKVVNEKIDWSCCVRFVDADDKPVKTFKVKISPKE